MKFPAALAGFLLVFPFLLLTTGCGGSAQSFYTLTPDGPAPMASGRGIGVGPVTIAEYLDRSNIVVSEGENQLGVAESHRWAGELSESIARVTATNLGRRKGTGNTHTYPWNSDSQVRWQIALDIRQLHGGADGNAVIEASWRAYALPERRLVASRNFVASEPLEKDGYPALVAAQSRLLSRLADEIAARLR